MTARKSRWIAAMLEAEAAGKCVCAVEMGPRGAFRLVFGGPSESGSANDDDWTAGAGQKEIPRAQGA